jgi:eukaryotic-like serine/threonine-protein kinase
VLELVEGETLAERLKSGPIPVPEAITISRQIADALQAAHEKGIIHRDLKPANIAFSGDGQVKVLDFGLAKALDPEPLADLANSPTMTLGGTQAGVILGTAAYMAPEQAKGRQADKRSDVWAFGCVLYEMLTGKRAFEGEDVSETLAAVLRGEPNWTALPAQVPPMIHTLVQQCLAKDRKRRIAEISTAYFLLTEAGVGPVVPVSSVSAWRTITRYIATFLTGTVVAGAITWLIMPDATSPSVSRFVVATSADAPLDIGGTNRDVAITPDGERVIYEGPNGILYVRSLDQLDPTPLPVGGAVAGGPFVSPDGEWIGFGDGRGNLKRVAITGGPTTTLASNVGTGLRGGTWLPDGSIVFADYRSDNRSLTNCARRR